VNIFAGCVVWINVAKIAAGKMSNYQ
jgi:hypothetical protein